jgi:hypothetical protein
MNYDKEIKRLKKRVKELEAINAFKTEVSGSTTETVAPLVTPQSVKAK